MEVLDIIEKHNEVVGVAHITGGGLNENINRILGEGLICNINESKWEVPDVFRWIQRESGISDIELRRTFNCGIGMVIIVKKDCEVCGDWSEELIEIGVIN